MQTRQQYEALLDNPNVQQALSLIRFTEGTSKYSDPYAVAFGGSKFDYTKGHPKTLRSFSTKKGGRQKTSAHGAYQFLSKTWDDVASKLNLKDMTPRNQDIAALALIDGRRALKNAIDGDMRGFVKKTNKEWASLPGSPYGQPTKSWAQIDRHLTSSQQPQFAELPNKGPVPTFASPILAGAEPKEQGLFASLFSAPKAAAGEMPEGSIFANIPTPTPRPDYSPQPQFTGPLKQAEKQQGGIFGSPQPFERSNLSRGNPSQVTDLPTRNPHTQSQVNLAPTPSARPVGRLEKRADGYSLQSAPIEQARSQSILGGYQHPMGMAAQTRLQQAPEAPTMGLLGDILVGSPDLVRNQQFAKQQPDKLIGGPNDISKPLGVDPEDQLLGPVMDPNTFPDKPAQPKQGLMDKIKNPRNIGRVGGAMAGSVLAGPAGSILGAVLGSKLGNGYNGQIGMGAGGAGGGILGSLFSSANPNQYSGPLNTVGYGGGQGPMAARYGAAGTAYRDSAGGLTISNGGQGFTRTNPYGVTEFTNSSGDTSVVSGGQSLLGGFMNDMREAFSRK